MLSSRYKRKRKRPELTIAPLIDIVFLLLIFFVVTTAFSQETGVVVEKPKATKSDLIPKENLIIAVTREGQIYIEKENLSLKEVRAKVRKRLAINPATTVIIMPDKETLTGALVDVLDECKIAGATKLSIATKVEINE